MVNSPDNRLGRTRHVTRCGMEPFLQLVVGTEPNAWDSSLVIAAQEELCADPVCLATVRYVPQ